MNNPRGYATDTPTTTGSMDACKKASHKEMTEKTKPSSVKNKNPRREGKVVCATPASGGFAEFLARGVKGEKTRLPDGFTPTDNHVICGKGKECFNHPGNKRFRAIVENSMDRYKKAAASKPEKSIIVSEIIDMIRMNDPRVGGFLRKDPVSGAWYEIGVSLAREKVGHAIRDATVLRNPERSQARKELRAINKQKRRAGITKNTQQLQQQSLPSSPRTRAVDKENDVFPALSSPQRTHSGEEHQLKKKQRKQGARTNTKGPIPDHNKSSLSRKPRRSTKKFIKKNKGRRKTKKQQDGDQQQEREIDLGQHSRHSTTSQEEEMPKDDVCWPQRASSNDEEFPNFGTSAVRAVSDIPHEPGVKMTKKHVAAAKNNEKIVMIMEDDGTAPTRRGPSQAALPVRTVSSSGAGGNHDACPRGDGQQQRDELLFSAPLSDMETVGTMDENNSWVLDEKNPAGCCFSSVSSSPSSSSWFSPSELIELFSSDEEDENSPDTSNDFLEDFNTGGGGNQQESTTNRMATNVRRTKCKKKLSDHGWRLTFVYC